MVTLHQTATDQELERILATFRAGHALCKQALFTALYALVTFLLVIVHVFTFVVNFTIGILMCLHALGCMARLVLVQLQEATRTPLVTVAGRSL
jgi:hypothetical protein